MVFWKSLAIALAIFLSISYIGFGFVLSQGGGISLIGITTGPRPKVVTLLKNANMTVTYWNASVDTSGYKTAYIYCYIEGGQVLILYRFEIDNIFGEKTKAGGAMSYRSFYTYINIVGPRIRIFAQFTTWYYKWIIISISLYLRD